MESLCVWLGSLQCVGRWKLWVIVEEGQAWKQQEQERYQQVAVVVAVVVV